MNGSIQKLIWPTLLTYIELQMYNSIRLSVYNFYARSLSDFNDSMVIGWYVQA